jgi:hypothetical protein
VVAALHRKILGTALVFCSLLAQSFPLSRAREQQQMQHPGGPLPTGPIGAGYFNNRTPVGAVPGLVPSSSSSPYSGNASPSYSTSSGGSGVPGLSAPSGGQLPGGTQAGGNHVHPQGQNEMVQRMLATRIPAGTVLRGVLSEDISSKKSVPGDLFYISLLEGYFLGGREIIPRKSVLVGAIVNVMPAAMHKRTGMPGQVEIGLTTLEFPDGRRIAFTGNIERNPAHVLKLPPKVKGAGMSMADYGKEVGSMVTNLGTGFGFVMARRNRGKDLLLEKGELLEVRVTKGLDLTQMSQPVFRSPVAGSSGSGQLIGTPSSSSPSPSPSPAALIIPRELPDPF